MTDKTFKQRVREEAGRFDEIYADIKKHLSETRFETQSDWEYLFSVPFGYVVPRENPTDDALRALEVQPRYYAARETIQQLELDKLRLGPLIMKDLRVSAALEAGVLTPDEIVPPSPDDPAEFDRMAVRLTTDCTDPIFWRALLEMFCRVFIATSGTKPWTLEDYIELAFDLDEIRRSSQVACLTADEARSQLRRNPYLARYHDGKDGRGVVGENRIRKITNLIGPMDDDALERLKALFPDAFFEVDDKRWRRGLAEKHHTLGILDLGETIGDALVTPAKPSDGG